MAKSLVRRDSVITEDGLWWYNATSRLDQRMIVLWLQVRNARRKNFIENKQNILKTK